MNKQRKYSTNWKLTYNKQWTKSKQTENTQRTNRKQTYNLHKNNKREENEQITNVEQTETLLLLTQLQIYGHEQVQTSLQTYTLDIRLEVNHWGNLWIMISHVTPRSVLKDVGQY